MKRIVEGFEAWKDLGAGKIDVRHLRNAVKYRNFGKLISGVESGRIKAKGNSYHPVVMEFYRKHCIFCGAVATNEIMVVTVSGRKYFGACHKHRKLRPIGKEQRARR